MSIMFNNDYSTAMPVCEVRKIIVLVDAGDARTQRR